MDVLNYMNENGVSSNEAAAIFNISSPALIRKWRIQLKTSGYDALFSKKKGRPSMKKETNTSRRLTRITSSRNQPSTYGKCVFKKVELLSSSQGNITKEDKVKVIYELRHKYSVKALVAFAGIERSTYYDLVKKMNRPDRSDADLKAEIQAIYDEHEGRYGYRRIRDELANREKKVNHKKVQRLMKILGLKCIVRMKKYKSYKGTVGKIAPNILNRNFTAEAPNESG